MLSHETDVLGPSHRPQNCCLLLVVLDALACQEGTAAVAKLKKNVEMYSMQIHP